MCLTVSDSGVGLPEDFDPQESPRDSLGMKIVNGLVKQLKAELAVEPAAPDARFVIRISSTD